MLLKLSLHPKNVKALRHAQFPPPTSPSCAEATGDPPLTEKPQGPSWRGLNSL